MTVLITLTTAGIDSGPFYLYSNLDGYVSAFESGVSRASLLAGYSSALVPDFTTIIRVQSVGDCTNYIDIQLYATSTTSTSTSSTSSTTTTSTTIANTCYAFESDPYTTTFTAQYIDCDGVIQTASDTCFSPSCTYTLCGIAVLSSSEIMNIVSVCGTTTTTSTTSAPTTTTTTTGACPSYQYNVTFYDCGVCTVNGGGGFDNLYPLTVGKFYYYPPLNLVVGIDSYVSCGGTPIFAPILDIDQEDTCAAVICPTTTTTTTPIP